MKFPSLKKLPLIPVLVAIFLAIGLILFINAYSKKEAFSQFNLFGGNEAVVESQNKDSDNDGLKDWQEDLYKTDSNNPDTDGDGYLDGEEINSSHNPLVKAPGDEQMFYPLPIGDLYNVTNKVLSDEMLSAFVDSYFTQKGEYISDHPDITSPEQFDAQTKTSTVQEMALRAVADSYPVLLENAETMLSEMPKIFDIEISDQDINISQDNSQAAINSYVSQVSSILNSETFFLQEQIVDVVRAAFQDGDFSKLDAVIKTNDEKIERAKKITVPSTWKEVHKEGLALTLVIRNIFVSFRDAQNDPLKAYIAANRLDGFSGQWNDMLKKAIDLAKTQGINLPL